MRAVQITESDGVASLTVVTLPSPQGDGVLIDVAYSSLNFKDAMCVRPGSRVRRRTPLVGGVDAVGIVRVDPTGRFTPGMLVIASGGDIGTARDGGFATELLADPVTLTIAPDGLTARQAAICGTAGWTAMASLLALQQHGCRPDDGDILVTGATGGVGSFAIALLAHAGYRVVASTGATEDHDWLRELGAHEIIGRDDISDNPDRVLATERWAGAIDCVGGQTLHQILRSLRYGGVVAASGLVAGADLSTTVYPFITRAVSLVGIDAVLAPAAQRQAVWELLRDVSRTLDFEQLTHHTVSLDGVAAALDELARGTVRGRVVVQP